MFRLTLSIVLLLAMAPLGFAAMTLVDDNFDSYADTNAFTAVWTPDNGNGTSPIGGPVGILVPDLNAGLVPPNDDPPGLEGKAVNVLNDINEYNGPNVGLLAELVPTETESIRLTGDIFDDLTGNKRTSIGLRNDTVFRSFNSFFSNIVEMGLYNAVAADPTDANEPPAEVINTDYAYRIAVFGARGGDLVREPDWQYFELDLALDIDDRDLATEEPTPDGIVSGVDIGPGWHRYSTTITPTDITFTLDLFRDGVTNLTRDVDGNIEVGVGDAGVDASVTWEIMPASDNDDGLPFDPFTSLRIGAPSGITGNNESVIDNILLETIDVIGGGGNADFDGSNLVDGDDFLTWQGNLPINDGTALQSDGDATGEGNIDGDDLAVWQEQYGTNPNAAASAGVVPEPTTAFLASLAALGLATFGRKR